MNTKRWLECIKGWIQVKKRRKDEMLNLNVYKDDLRMTEMKENKDGRMNEWLRNWDLLQTPIF